MASRKLRFAIFGNTYQPKKSVSVQKLLACLTERQANVCIEREFYDFLTTGQRLPIENVQIIEGGNFDADFVISMGGDGTFLRAASMVGGKQIPILGINTGRLGFLADVNAQEYFLKYGASDNGTEANLRHPAGAGEFLQDGLRGNAFACFASYPLHGPFNYGIALRQPACGLPAYKPERRIDRMRWSCLWVCHEAFQDFAFQPSCGREVEVDARKRRF